MVLKEGEMLVLASGSMRVLDPEVDTPIDKQDLVKITKPIKSRQMVHMHSMDASSGHNKKK